MRVEFTCDEKDFREAHGMHHGGANQRGRARGGWQSTVRQVVSLLIIVGALGLTLFSVFASTPSSVERTLPLGSTLALRFLAASSITLTFLILWSVGLTRTLVRPTRKPWEVPTPGQRWKRRLITVGVTVAAVWFMLEKHGNRSTPGPTRPTAYELTLSIVPWFSVVVILIVFRIFHARNTVRRNWAGQPSLHRPYVLEADEGELTLAEPLSSHRYQWEHFAGYRETENLIVLYVSPFAFWMVPKRAFLPEELQTFKSLLLTHVKQGLFLPIEGRFAVLPPAPLASALADRVTT